MAEEERERQEGTAGGTAVEVSDDERAARRERARARKRRRAASGEGASSGSSGARAGDTELMRPPRRDAPGEGGYEFGDAENVKFRGLAGLMQFVGWSGVVLGLVAAIWGFPRQGASVWSWVLWLFQISLPILVGVFTVRAAGAYKRIATTRGSDIHHLMDAVGEMTKLYTVQAVVVVLAMALIVLAMVLVSTNRLF